MLSWGSYTGTWEQPQSETWQFAKPEGAFWRILHWQGNMHAGHHYPHAHRYPPLIGQSQSQGPTNPPGCPIVPFFLCWLRSELLQWTAPVRTTVQTSHPSPVFVRTFPACLSLLPGPACCKAAAVHCHDIAYDMNENICLLLASKSLKDLLSYPQL